MFLAPRADCGCALFLNHYSTGLLPRSALASVFCTPLAKLLICPVFALRFGYWQSIEAPRCLFVVNLHFTKVLMVRRLSRQSGLVWSRGSPSKG